MCSPKTQTSMWINPRLIIQSIHKQDAYLFASSSVSPYRNTAGQWRLLGVLALCFYFASIVEEETQSELFFLIKEAWVSERRLDEGEPAEKPLKSLSYYVPVSLDPALSLSHAARPGPQKQGEVLHCFHFILTIVLRHCTIGIHLRTDYLKQVLH